MIEAELDRFSHNGSTFYLKSRLFASLASGRKDEMMQALKDNRYGSLVVETVNANTLASFIKEQREVTGEDIPAWLGDTVSTYKKSVGRHPQVVGTPIHCTNAKITNLFTVVDTFQEEPVNDVRKEAIYRIRFEAENGELISNEVIFPADSREEDPRRRIFRLEFDLERQRYSGEKNIF